MTQAGERDGDMSTQELAAWYHENAPETDALDFAAELAIIRVYQLVTVPPGREGRKRFNNLRFNVLRLLYQTEARQLLMSEIGRGLNVGVTNVTTLVNELVAEGLVRRADHPRDKRKKWAVLTPKGARAFEAELPFVAQVVKRLWGVLDTDDKQQLVRLLAKYADRVRESAVSDEIKALREARSDAAERR
ncbi:MAG TPA: MarR family transcriptional regulator [Dehalococcoidia bacterium]|nr:MarR family transcriptional regulator [Dehalococcoidia bacterium]